MSRLLRLLGRSRMTAVLATSRVVLMELPGAIRTFEFMAFTGNARQGNGHEKQGEKFHRAAS